MFVVRNQDIPLKTVAWLEVDETELCEVDRFLTMDGRTEMLWFLLSTNGLVTMHEGIHKAPFVACESPRVQRGPNEAFLDIATTMIDMDR